MTDKTDPWKPLPGEGPREYLYFQVYLEKEYLPKHLRHLPRTLKDVARFLQGDLSEVLLMAARYRWESRAREYDLSTLGKRLRGEVETLEELSLRKRKLFADNLDLIEEVVSLVRAEVAQGKVPKMDLAKLLDVTLHYQNEVNETGQREGEVGEGWDLTELSDTELETLEALRKKARKNAPK